MNILTDYEDNIEKAQAWAWEILPNLVTSIITAVLTLVDWTMDYQIHQQDGSEVFPKSGL